jgi:hypothetical protein
VQLLAAEKGLDVSQLTESKIRGLRANLWICCTCKEKVKNGKLPELARKNRLALTPIPPELACLTRVELQLISQVHVFQTILTLPKGQTGAKGLAISFSHSVAPVVEQLPRLADDSGIVLVRTEARPQGAQGKGPSSPSRETGDAAEAQATTENQAQEGGDAEDELDPAPAAAEVARQRKAKPKEFCTNWRKMQVALNWLRACKQPSTRT